MWRALPVVEDQIRPAKHLSRGLLSQLGLWGMQFQGEGQHLDTEGAEDKYKIAQDYPGAAKSNSAFCLGTEGWGSSDNIIPMLEPEKWDLMKSQERWRSKKHLDGFS